MKLKFKLNVVAISIALLPVVLLGTYQSITRYFTQMNLYRAELIDGVSAKSDEFSMYFEGLTRDVSFAAETAQVESLLTGYEDEDSDEVEYWTESLDSVLKAFAANRKVFSEFAFSKTGEEPEVVVQVRWDGATAVGVDEKSPPPGFEKAVKSEAATAEAAPAE